jgi:hypothetical protein
MAWIAWGTQLYNTQGRNTNKKANYTKRKAKQYTFYRS